MKLVERFSLRLPIGFRSDSATVFFTLVHKVAE